MNTRLKKIPAYQTTDGSVFHGSEAHKEASTHQRAIDLKEKQATYLRNMVATLNIDVDEEELMESFAEAFADEGFVDDTDIDDAIYIINDLIDFVGPATLQQMLNVFNRDCGHTFSKNNTRWNSSEKEVQRVRY